MDIETTGLDARIHDVTVVCTFDGTIPRAYHFRKPAIPVVLDANGVVSPSSCQTAGVGCTCPDSVGRNKTTLCTGCVRWHERNKEELFTALDGADYIGGYNIIGFDLPFLRKCFKVDSKRCATFCSRHFLA